MRATALEHYSEGPSDGAALRVVCAPTAPSEGPGGEDHRATLSRALMATEIAGEQAQGRLDEIIPSLSGLCQPYLP